MELQLREAEQRKKLADNVSWHSHMKSWALCVSEPAGDLQQQEGPVHCAPQGCWRRLVGQCPKVLLAGF